MTAGHNNRTHLQVQITTTACCWVWTTIFTPHTFSSQKPQPGALFTLPQWLETFINQHNHLRYSRAPLNISALKSELTSHPDRLFVHNLIGNLINGCDIGYTRPQFTYRSNNLHSAYQQPTILDATIAEECKAGRVLGPFDKPPLPCFRSSGLGLVPKHDGGWRTICHLSVPHGSSVNDFIDPDIFTLTYCSVDDAYVIVNSLGAGALISKIDLKSAFRLISVRPRGWNLLGIQWREKFYVDTSAGMNVYFPHLEVLLLKRTNVRMFVWLGLFI